ncbi:glycoside hydrolase family 2 protein [Solitalea lacus]|uniref:glycoside hydrolase family 2 protein n=1 Tax=Solitalea lacus TaxID=2911172 RepID=UPI001EDBCDF5|nr:glycoside hydrolase family 2 TIM barrel-domain containing protein [Solitalea lacus]UKJ08828.1 glycosyl hydrolase [Solitalea lacus]
MKKRLGLLIVVLLSITPRLTAQNRYELNSGWVCAPKTLVKDAGTVISSLPYSLQSWKPAVVPGTVLTTMLANKEIPDPFWGMNNKKIPDIYQTGRDYYTYWFAKDFKEIIPSGNSQVWLTFRGINYSCDIFLNGKKVNASPFAGMFLRKSFNITSLLSKSGNNRLVVIVYPPDPVGNPNGGQGGDGTIARNVSHQYVAGWDWIQPIRDRNTGIWDKVYIEQTGAVNVNDPHVVTLVPGKRKTTGRQAPAQLKVSADLHNATNKAIQGVLRYNFDGKTISKAVLLKANSVLTVNLPVLTINTPRLWWPAGYGDQPLYKINLEFVENGTVVTDAETVSFGIREIQTEWNERTRSKQVLVNGQKIFIKGGNWIISDAMLRFSKERYDAEVRFHRDMNLNLIRIWGGALVERPEFYEACDKYGLLVFQDFWISGDCNGRWIDPMKLEDQWTRRKYPDDHKLFLESAADMIKMVRNHPSLAMWCGGNEMTPPEDILVALRDSILPALDGTRWFVEYSNADEMSYNSIGGNGDGPYGIQKISTFWEQQTYPFNSEVGSVGIGDYESLERFIPKENMIVPFLQPGMKPAELTDSVWTYHKYSGVGYGQFIEPYGKPKDIEDFALKAQLVNYDQYRGLIEGFSSKMWDWYTGVIIWKTQNPWTAMRGQMYDYYLDPNACLYGLRSGSELLHIMCNPVDGMVMVVNNGVEAQRNLMLEVKVIDMEGKEKLLTQVFSNIDASSVKKYLSIKKEVDVVAKDKGAFLSLRLLDENKKVLSDNFYWLPDSQGKYSGLQEMKSADLQLKVRKLSPGTVEVTLKNPEGGRIAFFNRLSVVDKQTSKRILPVFYSDNYLSVLPGAEKKVVIEFEPNPNQAAPLIKLQGWNVAEKNVAIE